MKVFLYACLLVAFLLQGCKGESVAGKYYNTADTAEYLELGAGNTFYLKADQKDLTGIYAVDGKRLTLNSGRGDIVASGKIEGELITDREGVKWRKR